MSKTIVAVVAGIGFILLGRWIYGSPKTLYVRAVDSSPDAPSLRFGAKLFGTLAIFIGSYAVVAGIADLLIHRALVVIALGLIIAATSAWLLRPAVKSVPALGKRQPLTLRSRLLIAVLLGIAFLFTATVLILIRVGDGARIPLASMIAGGISVIAIAGVLWLPKRTA